MADVNWDEFEVVKDQNVNWDEFQPYPDRKSEMKEVEERGLDIRPRVPSAGIPSDPSGIPLDQSLTEAAIEDYKNRVRSREVNALEGVRFLSKQGEDLPKPTSSMYEGLSADDAWKLYKIYESSADEGEKKRILSAGPTYKGYSIPSPQVHDIPLLGAPTRAGNSFLSGVASGAREIASTAGAGIDSIAGTNISQSIDEESPKYITDDLSDELFMEMGRQAIPIAATMGVGGGALRKFGTDLVGSTLATPEEESLGIGKNLVEAGLGLVSEETVQAIQDGDEYAKEKLTAKLGTAIELGVLMGAGSGVFKAGEWLGGIVKGGVTDPILSWINDKKGEEFLARSVFRDLQGPLSKLSVEDNDLAFKAIRESLDRYGAGLDSEVPTDTLTAVSEGLRALADEDEYKRIASQLYDVADRAVGVRKSSSLSGLYNLADSESKRLSSPDVKAQSIDATMRGKEEVPSFARKTGEAVAREARETKESLVEKYSKLHSSISDIEKRVMDEVDAKYAAARDPIKNLPASEEIIEDLKLAGVKIKDDASFQDVTKSIKQLNKKIDQELKSGGPNVVSLIELKDRIYDSELEDLVISEGLDLSAVKSAFNEARVFYRDEYADVFISGVNARPVGMAATSATKGVGRETKAGTRAREKSTRESFSDAINKGASDVIEDTKDVFSRKGTEEEMISLEDVISTQKTSNLQEKSSVDFINNVISPFVQKRKLVDYENLPATKNNLTFQMDKLFKGGVDDSDALINEMKKRLSPEDYNLATDGLKQSSLDWVRNQLTDGGKLSVPKYNSNMENAFTLINSLPLDKYEKTTFKTLESLFRRVGDAAARSERSAPLTPFVSSTLGKGPEGDATSGLYKITSFVFGVLNNTATKVRQAIGAGSKTIGPDRQQFFINTVDEMLSNPKYYGEQLDKLAKMDGESGKRLAVIKKLFRPALATMYRTQPWGKSFESELDKFVNDANEQLELQYMESSVKEK